MTKGYTFDKARGKYNVRVTVDGKRKFIGRFDTPEEAHIAYLANSPSDLSRYKEDMVETPVKNRVLFGMKYLKWLDDLKKARQAKKTLEDYNDKQLEKL